MNVESIWITVAFAKDSYPGRAEHGYFVVHGDVVTLTDAKGNPIDKKKHSRTLRPSRPRVVKMSPHLPGQLSGTSQRLRCQAQ